MAAPLSEFAALIHSFGESLVMHVGKPHLQGLEVRGYEGSDTADVLIWLETNTWDEQLAAMDQVEAVRLMFLGELSFEYRFLDEKEDAPAVRENTPAYSLA